MKWNLLKVRLNQGGYDAYGTYYGIGAPLYRADTYSDDIHKPDYHLKFRAKDRDNAKRYVLANDPNATFYR